MKRRLLVLTMLAALAGCQWVQDRARACRHLRVDLVNDFRGGPRVNMALEFDPDSDENLVNPGASRQVVICAERGDRKRARVAYNGEILRVANCVTTGDPSVYEFTVARVVWDGYNLRCENW
jgi:hypothetical protein